jgi:DNA-directed RNA polymerase subunit N (RpoN/RPB10)|tara:strand:+ start:100 stop:360 length:261 start_codon:yes stop_codon:yes gene_type:complete
MIIPIRCFTCGEITGDKWTLFKDLVNEKKKESNKIINNNNLDIDYIDTTLKKNNKSIEGEILDEIGLHKYCCRRMLLSNVNLVSII